MIVAIFLVLGLTLRLATFRGFAGLSESQLRGEVALMVLLASQVAAPALHLTGSAARIAFYVWLATFPAIVGIAWMNRRAPGMVVLAAGLMLNFVVIAANGGMPVFGAAMAVASPSGNYGSIPVSDFIHVIGTTATRLPWLADVVPLSGPAWLRLVASPGDLLLCVGIAAFLGAETGETAPAMPTATNKQECA